MKLLLNCEKKERNWKVTKNGPIDPIILKSSSQNRQNDSNVFIARKTQEI